MGTPVDPKNLRRAVDGVRRHGSVNAAAAAMGIPRATLQGRYKKAITEGIEEEKIEFPEFVTAGDEDTPVEDIINRMQKSVRLKKKQIESRNWFPIKVNESKPYGVLWFGDPHLGPNCDWDILLPHIEIANKDGVYGANIGDTTDNWPWTGRMARLWAESDTSHEIDRRLATWFMVGAGIKWLVWLGGNHDEWNGGMEFYKMLGAYQVPVIDWRAQFTLKHPSGTEVRIDASHGRKGSSIYNPVHGTLRAAKFGEDADAYITGHTHNFGIFEIEFEERSHSTWLAQISGYKLSELYDKMKGFAQSNKGHGVLMIVYPDTGRVRMFSDPEEGYEFLSWLRR